MPSSFQHDQLSPSLENRPLLGLSALDEDSRREYWATLALRCTEGLGRIGICTLLKHFGSAWEAVRNTGLWNVPGIERNVAAACASGSWRSAARPEWESAKHFQGHILLWTDTRYPRALRELDDAPALLYAIGDLSLLDSPCVAIVGSRKCSTAAQDFAATISEGLSSAGITVVSGMAFGIDARAHRSALSGPGRTIAVLAGGADIPYPAMHTELYRKITAHGLVISEIPPGTKPGPGAFPVRNRIISGLSLGVLMAEAENEKSGSLITARLAAEQGRNVYIPAPGALRTEYRDGTAYLLQNGAFPVWRADDIIADLLPHLKHAVQQESSRKNKVSLPPIEQNSPSTPPAPMAEKQQQTENTPSTLPVYRPELSSDENELLQLLIQAPLSPDDLLLSAQERDASWTAPRMLAALMMLEVKKLVRRLSDSRYEVRP